MKYDKTEIAGWFGEKPDVLDKCKVLVAYYDSYAYEGYAFVLYKKGKKLYEVNGSHCSCYGLENQWQPEETSKESLMQRKSLKGKMKDIFPDD